MKGPCVGWQDLALRLQSSVGVPVLGAQEQTAKCLGAARVDKRSIGLGGTRENSIVVG